MDRAYKITTAVIIFFLVAGYAGYTFFLKPDTLQVIATGDSLIAKEIQAQTATERTWAKDFIGKEQMLAPAIHDSVYRGVGMKRYGKYLYIADFGEMSLKRFDLKGHYVSSFGKGKGRGPGEFQLISDCAFSSDGEVYVLDSRKRELIEFDGISTEYLSSFTIKSQPLRLVASGKNIIIESLVEEKMFKVYNKEGSLLHEFGKIINNQLQNSLSAYGELKVINKNGYFIFVPSKASYIFYYDSAGNRIKTVQAIDKIPFKKSVRSAKDNIRSVRPPVAPVETFGIQVFKGKLYLSQLSRGQHTSLPASFLDVYALQSGSYLYSVALPVKTNDVVFTSDTVYLLTNDTESVKAYAYHEPS